ncbi:unnamed protein product [Symbiodinium sp. CCMP2592]|nr:unnamed protein product [Symbiodinium sp. CCMP2592]
MKASQNVAHAKLRVDDFRDDAAREEFNLELDEHLVQRWRHLASKADTRQNGAHQSGALMSWWMVVYRWVAVRSKPSLEGQILTCLARGDPVFCVAMEGPWVKISLDKEPPVPPTGGDLIPSQRRLQNIRKNGRKEAWMMWDGQIKGLPVLLQPVMLLDRLLAYRHSDVTLPREAVSWTASEVDIFLGSLGFIRPGRESALMRSTKRLVRSIRGGYKPLEFRVDHDGKESGVFSGSDITQGDLVEVCPLHEVPAKLRAISPVLQRITIPMRMDEQRYAIVLGFGKVYTRAATPNLRWSYRGEDEVVLWADEDILSGRELTVDFGSAPAPLGDARPPPSTWQAPPPKSGTFSSDHCLMLLRIVTIVTCRF